MLRKVYLDGELGAKYGTELSMDVDSVADVFRLLEANYPDLKRYLVECHQKNIGFTCKVGEQFIEDENDLVLPIKGTDLFISPIPAGSKSGLGKILAAIAIIAIAWYVPTLFTYQGTLLGSSVAVQGSLGAAMAGAFGGVAQFAALTAVSMSINLAIAGVQQIMAPDPSVDKEEPTSYLFNGGSQNIVEGDPIPLLYGELQVPGRPVGLGIMSANQYYTNATSGSGGKSIVTLPTGETIFINDR